jgi:hypothetical protein
LHDSGFIVSPNGDVYDKESLDGLYSGVKYTLMYNCLLLIAVVLLFAEHYELEFGKDFFFIVSGDNLRFAYDNNDICFDLFRRYSYELFNLFITKEPDRSFCSWEPCKTKYGITYRLIKPEKCLANLALYHDPDTHAEQIEGVMKAIYPNSQFHVVREYGKLWSKITGKHVRLSNGYSLYKERDRNIISAVLKSEGEPHK